MKFCSHALIIFLYYHCQIRLLCLAFFGSKKIVLNVRNFKSSNKLLVIHETESKFNIVVYIPKDKYKIVKIKDKSKEIWRKKDTEMFPQMIVCISYISDKKPLLVQITFDSKNPQGIYYFIKLRYNFWSKINREKYIIAFKNYQNFSNFDPYDENFDELSVLKPENPLKEGDDVENIYPNISHYNTEPSAPIAGNDSNLYPDVKTTVGLADSSPNSLPVNGNATPGDRGRSVDVSGVEYKTSSGVPAADLREAEGEVNGRADGRIGSQVESSLQEEDKVTSNQYNSGGDTLYSFENDVTDDGYSYQVSKSDNKVIYTCSINNNTGTMTVDGVEQNGEVIRTITMDDIGDEFTEAGTITNGPDVIPTAPPLEIIQEGENFSNQYNSNISIDQKTPVDIFIDSMNLTMNQYYNIHVTNGVNFYRVYYIPKDKYVFKSITINKILIWDGFGINLCNWVITTFANGTLLFITLLVYEGYNSKYLYFALHNGSWFEIDQRAYTHLYYMLKNGTDITGTMMSLYQRSSVFNNNHHGTDQNYNANYNPSYNPHYTSQSDYKSGVNYPQYNNAQYGGVQSQYNANYSNYNAQPGVNYPQYNNAQYGGVQSQYNANYSNYNAQPGVNYPQYNNAQPTNAMYQNVQPNQYNTSNTFGICLNIEQINNNDKYIIERTEADNKYFLTYKAINGYNFIKIIERNILIHEFTRGSYSKIVYVAINKNLKLYLTRIDTFEGNHLYFKKNNTTWDAIDSRTYYNYLAQCQIHINSQSQ